MMGRLQTWIDRLGRARRRQGATGQPARQRTLRYEQCESRLALSAESPIAALSDGDSIVYAEFMSNLWAGTPGADQWAQTTFVLGNEAVTTPKSMRIDFAIDRDGLPPVRNGLAEGGLIVVDAFATLGAQDFAFARQLNASVDGAPNRLGLQGQLNDAATFQMTADNDGGTSALVDLNASTPISSGPIGFEPTISGAFNPGKFESGTIGSGAILPGDLDSQSSWNFEPTDAPDLLGEADGTSPTADGGALNTTPPILRITAPLDSVRNEGGRIDLTAMAGPTSLELKASHALTDQEAMHRTASRADDLPAAAANENLRARAVVYEVAYQREDKPNASAEGMGALLNETSPRTQSADVSTPSSQSGQADGRDHAAPTADLTSFEIDDAAASDANSATPSPDTNDSVRRDAASAHDAAFASLGSVGDAASGLDDHDADAGLALTDARHRNLSLAIALAVTAAPLARRYRRSKQAHASARNAGLS